MLNLVDSILFEEVKYGGFIATRLEVYRDLLSLGGHKRADAFAFGYCKAATSAEIATLPHWGELGEKLQNFNA